MHELNPSEFDKHLEPIFLHMEKEAAQPGRYNPEHFYPTWQKLMQLGIARTWEVPGCVLGALFFDDAFSGKRQGAVHFWWALPEVRGTGAPIRVFKQFERAARASGCKQLLSYAYETLNPSNLHAVYPRLGYRQSETAFSKEL